MHEGELPGSMSKEGRILAFWEFCGKIKFSALQTKTSVHQANQIFLTLQPLGRIEMTFLFKSKLHPKTYKAKACNHVAIGLLHGQIQNQQ